MGLEERVEKGFLEKFGRKFRSLAIPLAFATALAGFSCGRKNINGPEELNKAPETIIVSGPSGIINNEGVNFEWKGEDEDGSVDKFHYFLVKSDTLFVEEGYTTETEKNFIDLNEGSYTLIVSAVDNENQEDLTPANRSFIISLEKPSDFISFENYVNECIKFKVDEELEKRRLYGGYIGPTSGLDFRVLTGPNPGIGRGIERDLRDYLETRYEVIDSFDELDINYGNPDVSVEMEDKMVIVNVNWPIVVKKDGAELELGEFNYVREEDIGYINNVIVFDIINRRLENGGDSLADWINQNKYVGVFYDNPETRDIVEGIKIEYPRGYVLYSIITIFDMERGLNDFRFAVETKLGR